MIKGSGKKMEKLTTNNFYMILQESTWKLSDFIVK